MALLSAFLRRNSRATSSVEQGAEIHLRVGTNHGLHPRLFPGLGPMNRAPSRNHSLSQFVQMGVLGARPKWRVFKISPGSPKMSPRFLNRLLLAIVSLAAGDALADGCFIWNKGADLNEPSQKAVVYWRDGRDENNLRRGPHRAVRRPRRERAVLCGTQPSYAHSCVDPDGCRSPWSRCRRCPPEP